MDIIPYTSIVGSLMYVMVCTILDIAHAVSLINRFMSNLGRSYCRALKWILRYIKGSLCRVLVYGGARNENGKYAIEVFVDSNYVSCLDTIIHFHCFLVL